MNIMTMIWNPRHAVEVKEFRINLYLFQFTHWKDFDRVLEEEPWTFGKNVVVLQPMIGGL